MNSFMMATMVGSFAAAVAVEFLRPRATGNHVVNHTASVDAATPAWTAPAPTPTWTAAPAPLPAPVPGPPTDHLGWTQWLTTEIGNCDSLLLVLDKGCNMAQEMGKIGMATLLAEKRQEFLAHRSRLVAARNHLATMSQTELTQIWTADHELAVSLREFFANSREIDQRIDW